MALLIKCILTLFSLFSSYKFVEREKAYDNNGGSVAQAKANSYMRKQWEVGKNNMKKIESLLDTRKEKTTLCVWYIFVLSLTSFL